MNYLEGITSCINKTFLRSGNTLPGENLCKDVNIKGSLQILRTDHKDFKEKIINTLFEPKNDLRCISDYVIISDKVILVCEMKSNNTKHAALQLKNTAEIIKYVLQMIKRYENIQAEIPPVKYVLFSSRFKNIKQGVKNDKLQSFTMDGLKYFRLPCNSKYILSQFIN